MTRLELALDPEENENDFPVFLERPRHAPVCVCGSPGVPGVAHADSVSCARVLWSGGTGLR